VEIVGALDSAVHKGDTSLADADHIMGGPMKNLIILLLLAGAGYMGYTRYKAGPYGLAPDQPLGDFAKMDSHLTGKLALLKSPLDAYQFQQLSLPEVPPAEKMFQYVHKRGDFRDLIVLTADKDDRLQAVVGSYVTSPPAQTQRFMRRYWRNVGGAKDPLFAAHSYGQGIFANRWKQATYAGEKVSGQWIKPPDDESFPSETILFKLK
jgi:hypothetical protein